MTTPAQRLTRYLDEGRLIRGAWHEGPRGPDGYEWACLRVAMYPDADEEGGAAACPTEDMPLWLAELLPWMDDAGTLEQWEPLTRRFAVVAHRWHVLGAAGWRRALLGSLAAIVTEARSHTTNTQVCDPVIALCREGAPADDPRWAAAEEAAAARSRASAAAASSASSATAKAVGAAAAASAKAAGLAAWARARAAKTWRAAARAAAMVAEAEAADRIIAGIIDAIETECSR